MASPSPVASAATPGAGIGVEPPHYEIGFGGFRVEDTILVTEDGFDRMPKGMISVRRGLRGVAQKTPLAFWTSRMNRMMEAVRSRLTWGRAGMSPNRQWCCRTPIRTARWKAKSAWCRGW